MRLIDVCVSYGKQEILKSVNLEVKNGEIFVLMGPSGSGKTTLVKGISGLIPFTAGRMEWKGEKGETGLVFQEPRLFPHMTVLENIAFGLRARGVPKKERLEKAERFLSILQLEGLGNRYPHQLSGGQKQRTALGRVLILEPDLLMLDEPFASLDAPLRLQLTDWLYTLQRDKKFSILWITHYLDEAFSVADRVGLLLDGEIVQEGKPVEIFQNPASEKVAAFFSLPNRLPQTKWKQWLKGVEADPNLMGWVPSDRVKVLPGYVTNSDPSNLYIHGTVSIVKRDGKGQTVIVDGGGTNFTAAVNILEEAPEPGSSVTLAIPVNGIIWYPYKDLKGTTKSAKSAIQRGI